jgi:hypothetical protein
MAESDKSKECLMNGLLGVALALGVLYVATSWTKEKFHFEVTPWKKTCLGNDPCPKCCNRGYMGQKVNFAYTSDVDRMNDSLTCAQKHTDTQQNNRNFYTLGNYSEGVAPGDFSYANN